VTSVLEPKNSQSLQLEWDKSYDMGIKINHYNLSIRDSSREPVCPGIREAVMY